MDDPIRCPPWWISAEMRFYAQTQDAHHVQVNCGPGGAGPESGWTFSLFLPYPAPLVGVACPQR